MIRDYSRLAEIVSLAERSKVTVDVGCDHGFVTEYLLRNQIADKVIATDISEKCLAKTKKLLEKKELSSKANFLQCDGLSQVHDKDIDQIIIAGMGGGTIVSILDNMSEDCKSARLILQPMNELRDVRLALCRLGYKITRDLIVRDEDKYYHILVASIGTQELTETQIYCGAVAADYASQDYQDWLAYTIQSMQNIVKDMPENNERRAKFLRAIDILKSVKN